MEAHCAVCVAAARQAFPQYTWEVIMAKAKTNQTFATDLATAIQAKAGDTAAGSPEDVRSCWTLGYCVEVDYLLYTEREFNEQYGLKPAEAGLQTETFKDENGQDILGVALTDERTQRRIKLHSYVDLSHAEWIHQRHQQLRDGQGMDAMLMWREDLRKTRGKTLKGATPKCRRGSGDGQEEERTVRSGGGRTATLGSLGCRGGGGTRASAGTGGGGRGSASAQHLRYVA